jgi:DNA-binding NarL/FixJ family response regulator
MLVDDHEVVRDGIKALLAATDDMLSAPRRPASTRPSPKLTGPCPT